MTPEQLIENAELDRLDSLPTRCCPFCASRMFAIHDTKTARAYQCDTCLSVYAITKGKTSWWYHGAQQPDTNGAPGDRVSGDGKGTRSPAPISFMEWQDLATEHSGAPFSQI